ncbi:SDR family NAD(P)-dependent oxidoreductase [Streptomyces cylindrosporus]|uniref:SDR family NAD(P)-dependent oxidoreductase n=1 Tax=Streptomyces cylindrosporus TaxID=2927583 RepID=A0ABS9YHR4_9ACTN|nr:SDR family NAD(P)-dependent oxidoreductase [Streptomyces cylindrosporus]MCI3276792.1 SDR family NAD(P)-dependent oxidoreductase [Streptomyces cylindrosporus]
MTDFTREYGPVAVITGASSGIGHSFAGQLAARGLDVVLVARRTDRLEELAQQLRRTHGVEATVVAADLADPAAPEQVLDTVADLDVGLLVSNAGFSSVKGPFEQERAEVLSSMLMVNSLAPTLLAHGLSPRWKERGRGGIVFTSSVEGLLGIPYSAAYPATKAYVIALAEALWAELGPAGVDVLALCPGATDTGAIRRQGINPMTLPHLMSPDDVARSALDHLHDGPVHIPSAHYQEMFHTLLAMPRRDALTTMARSMPK